MVNVKISSTAPVIDFCTFRANRFLGEFHSQAVKTRQHLGEAQENILALNMWLGSVTRTFNIFYESLKKHQLTCEKTQELNDECTQALEQGDLDTLIKFRNMMRDARRHN